MSEETVAGIRRAMVFVAACAEAAMIAVFVGLWSFNVGHACGYTAGRIDGFKAGESRGFTDGQQAMKRELSAAADASYAMGFAHGQKPTAPETFPEPNEPESCK